MSVHFHVFWVSAIHEMLVSWVCGWTTNRVWHRKSPQAQIQLRKATLCGCEQIGWIIGSGHHHRRNVQRMIGSMMYWLMRLRQWFSIQSQRLFVLLAQAGQFIFAQSQVGCTRCTGFVDGRQSRAFIVVVIVVVVGVGRCVWFVVAQLRRQQGRLLGTGHIFLYVQTAHQGFDVFVVVRVVGHARRQAGSGERMLCAWYYVIAICCVVFCVYICGWLVQIFVYVSVVYSRRTIVGWQYNFEGFFFICVYLRRWTIYKKSIERNKILKWINLEENRFEYNIYINGQNTVMVVNDLRIRIKTKILFIINSWYGMDETFRRDWREPPTVEQHDDWLCDD